VIKNFFAAAGLALALLALALLPLYYWQPVQAAPAGRAVEAITLNTAAVATSTTWSGGRWSALGSDDPAMTAEIWLFVDVGTVNTTTFGLQVSPDNSTWVDHSTAGTLAADVAADTNQFTVAAVQGVYYRIVATMTNTNTLTPTIKVVLR
jgi:hypothetical protein